MNKYYLVVLIVSFLTSCATYTPKYKDLTQTKSITTGKEVSHTFYLIGDAGLSPMGEMNPVLKAFKNKLGEADENSTAIFLGDNIYPAGFPNKKNHPEKHLEAKNHLDAQLQALDGYKGNPIFIPGNHDWYSDGLKGLEREEKYIQKKLGSKKVFFPENGCPIEKIDINDEIVVLAVDTEWYLVNWDKHPTINDGCEIKDREKFFEEIEGLIKKNAGKTIIIALHHPMFSYGTHGGQFSLKEQFYIGHNSKIPLPFLGTFVNLLRKTTGASIEDLNNKKYRALRKRLVTLAQYSEKVIFTSGHEHSLQYIVEENTPQIISGGGAKDGATRLMNGSMFSTGSMGYAVLEVYKDGSSQVDFYGVNDEDDEQHLFATEVLPSNKKEDYGTYKTDFPANIKAAIYTRGEVTKSKFHKSVWGDRYRKYYGTMVNAPTVRLDTLYGGLTPVRKGGGHQSKSLRLIDKNGKQYVMRALRKSAELYLQAMAFKEQYIVGDFDDTYTEKVLLDFYTGSHPYAPFTIGTLSDAVDIYHTNPILFYVPKQDALKSYNLNFGDELYMIEEHVSDGHNDLESFGYTKEIESTDDLLKKLRKDEKYSVDKTAYVRARLFDMMIGDWDRHTDQWRWAATKNESGEVIYKPIPRDRDQAFSIMGDGAFMGFASRVIPGLRLMEGFTEEIRSVKGFNSSPKTFALDMVIMPETTLALWEEQTAYIQQHITSEVIDLAFEKFPEEVRDETVTAIKKVLLARKNKLLQTASEYYGIINKYSVVTGTDKDDYFEIVTASDGKKEVTVYRIKNGKKGAIIFNKIYDREHTKEIWIYGLDDDDVFDVLSTDNTIKIRLIGGQNNDVYKVKQGKGVHIYDFKSKKNTFDEAVNAKIHRTDDYETNTYQFNKIKNSVNQLIPSIGSNPDDGFKIGLTDIYIHNGFKQNPFTQQHTFNAAFYFATKGFEFGYKGEFANVLENWNLELAARFTSSNFSINFFGLGNETINLEDALGMDYNRVKTEMKKIAPSLVWRGDLGAKFRAGVSYEDVEVEETVDRFVNTFYVQNGEESSKSFFGVDAEYTYANRDNEAFPTMGMATSLHVGYKTNVSGTGESFGFIVPSFEFNYKLNASGRLVLASKLKGHFKIGDGFEFYQAASIGGDNGLRGFRFQRFSGKKAYYQNTDIRYSFSKMRTGILPVSVGIYGGYDYGRVWLSGEDSDTWHTSYGGGFFLNASNIMTARISYFDCSDGPRIAFGVGFGF
ncbi:MAG: phosphoesterase [Flavobacteriaceae bacterium]|nr:MAG: phosphoesterase [Flavobacteriaceae bacterium]